MAEINLMKKYPCTRRDPENRVKKKTLEDIRIAKQFGKEFFDGDRRFGYGGYSYSPCFWKGVVEDMISHYCLTKKSSILDIGCAKGFMLYDFAGAVPGVSVQGIDISEYAIENAIDSMKPFLRVGDARNLEAFKDDEFDLVTSITTIHNLPLEECKQALREIQRIGKNAFITLDAWRNDEEKQRMDKWNLTAQTFMHVDNWKRLFKEVGYKGDYYWFIP